MQLRRLGRVLFWLVPSLVLQPGVPEARAADRWDEVRSPHFVVVTNAGEGTGRDVARQFEQVQHVFETLLPWSTREAGRPFVVFVLRRESDLRELAPHYWEGGRDGVASLYVSRGGVDYVALKAGVRLADDLNTNPYFFAFWGYAASVLEYSFPGRLPPWLQRGLADLLANTLVRGEDVHIGRVVGHHLKTFADGKRKLSTGELLAADWSSPFVGDEGWRPYFDAHAWALVHYLLFGDKGAHRPQFDRLIDMLLQGQPADVAAREVFGDFEAVARDVTEYRNRNLFGYVAVEGDLSLRDREFPVHEIPPAESAGRRAAFHVAMDRPDEARALAAESRAADPSAPYALEVEALLQDRDGREEEALAAFTHAAEAGSLNHWVHYRRAQLLNGPEASPETLNEVVASLRRAIELNPDHGRSHAALARVLSDLDPGDVAIAAAEKAVSLEGTLVSHRLALVDALWNAGRAAQAIQVAHAALPVARDDASREDVRKWIDYLRERQGAASTGGPAAGGRDVAAEQAACDAGQGAVCAALGIAYLLGQGVEAQPQKGVELLESGCALGTPIACANLANLYLHGRAVEADLGRAEALAATACDAGTLAACTILAQVHLARGGTEGLAAARQRLDQACAAGEASACELRAKLPD